MAGHSDGPAPGDAEPIGSVAEEAAKLLGAFSGWAREQSEGLSSFTDQGDHAHHPAHDPADECTWCPLCRTVAAVRRTSPEVVEHLSSAASSLMLALSGLMATPEPSAQGGEGVERIPLDDDFDDGLDDGLDDGEDER